MTIQQSPRSIELKREAARRVTDVVADVYAMPLDAIQIFFDEHNHENWSKGGSLAVDKRAVKKGRKIIIFKGSRPLFAALQCWVMGTVLAVLSVRMMATRRSFLR